MLQWGWWEIRGRLPARGEAMCGRIEHALSPEDYLLYFGLEVDTIEPNWDVRPTDQLPIIRQGEKGLEWVYARWGFPSSYGSKVLFNARSETVDQLPSFKDAYRKRRALLPVSGWYEWKDKERYLIRRKDRKPVVMAALWHEDCFTVLTTSPTQDIAEYHDRMPYLLLKRDWERWLLPTRDHSVGQMGLSLFPTGILVGTPVNYLARVV